MSFEAARDNRWLAVFTDFQRQGEENRLVFTLQGFPILELIQSSNWRVMNEGYNTRQKAGENNGN
jgi:hypothetical protein